MTLFRKKDDARFRPVVPGIKMRPLGSGEQTNMVEMHLDKGFVHEIHEHPYEQTGYLISGKLRVTIEDVQYLAEPGDGWSIPGGVRHGTEILEDTVVVEVFSPVREEYR